MRIALLVLGAVLILQVIIHALAPIFEGAFSAEKFAAALDEDMVRLTAGLCALSLAGLLKRREKQDSI